MSEGNAVESEQLQQSNSEEPVIKLYKRRWIIITIFIFYAAINSAQWIEYAIISNITMKYYGVSSYFVDWTSILFMACYAPLIVPASYIVNKMGLRTASLLGGLGTAIGTIIKVFSVHPDRFWIVFLGQFLVASSQTVIIGLPPRIAAVWFGADEISTAASLAVFGTQLGSAIGFFLPGLLVHNSDDLSEIGNDLYVLCWIYAGVMIPVGFAILFYFPNMPPHPPNHTQVVERNTEANFDVTIILKEFKQLMMHSGFLMHMFAYGINTAAFSAICTLLSQYVIDYFPGKDNYAGIMGTVQQIVGIVGSVIFGIFLDRTHRYKESCTFVAIMSCISVTGFLLSLQFTLITWAYIYCALFGLFTNAYWSVGFEMAAELAYPISDMTATGIILSSGQVLGVVFTVLAGWLLQNFGSFWSFVSQIAFLIVGIVCSMLTPNKLNRRAVLVLQNQNGKC